MTNKTGERGVTGDPGVKLRTCLLLVSVTACPTWALAQAAATDPPPGPTVSGYTQIDYRVAERPDEARFPEHEFNVRRARLTVSGNPTRYLAYSMTVQGDGLNANSASVLEAYADLKLRAGLKARVGQYKYDFDMEGRESANQIPLPDRPFPTVAVAGDLNGASTASVGSSGFRDRGLSLLGSTKVMGVGLKGAAGAFQGTGRASDDNGAISWVLNGQVEPMAAMRVNLGYLSSKGGTGAEAGHYWAATTGLGYETEKIWLRGEFYHGRRDHSRQKEQNGFYITGAYSATPRLDVIARYQRLKDERYATGENTIRAVDLGLKFFFIRKDRRSGSYLMAAYQFREADDAFKGVTFLGDGRGPAVSAGQQAGSLVVVRLQVRF